MQHFAQLDENNIVIFVCSAHDDNCLDENGNISEEVGINYCKSFYEPIRGQNTIWKQTCFENKMRVRYAGVGYYYDASLDAFIPPKRFPSWVFNPIAYIWEAPIPEPSLTQEQMEAGNCYYEWNEDILDWELITVTDVD